VENNDVPGKPSDFRHAHRERAIWQPRSERAERLRLLAMDLGRNKNVNIPAREGMAL
jgi:hypothetical protein